MNKEENDKISWLCSKCGKYQGTGPRYVKVEFFEESHLRNLREKMNSFFEKEELSKDRIIDYEIDYEIDKGRYWVMVVYE